MLVGGMYPSAMAHRFFPMASIESLLSSLLSPPTAYRQDCKQGAEAHPAHGITLLSTQHARTAVGPSVHCQTTCLENLLSDYPNYPKAGETPHLYRRPAICTAFPYVTATYVEVTLNPRHFSEAVRVMHQFMRQIGVAIGLTVVLTFPVTVVSGAGSQKQTGHVVRFAVSGKGQGRGTVMAMTKTERTGSSDDQVGGNHR